ncbi:hypothetical protein D9M71_646610 [compost metagenome]
MLDHFQATEDVTLGIGDSLALLCAQGRGNALGVFADQRLQLEHDAHARANRRVAPGLEGTLGGSHGGIDFFDRRERHLGQHLLGGRVDDVAPLAGFRFDPLAVDQQFDLRKFGLVGLEGYVHESSPDSCCGDGEHGRGCATGAWSWVCFGV